MKQIKHTVLCILCAALILTACGMEDRETESTATDGAQGTQGVQNTVATVTPNVSKVNAPPAWTVMYDGGSIELTSGNYDWTVDNGDGTMSCTQACGIRPCDSDGTPSINLSAQGGVNYTLMFRENGEVRNVTVTAYPMGQYEDKFATDCKVEDGKLPVLKGRYYYELIVHYAQGTATYGFFVE